MQHQLTVVAEKMIQIQPVCQTESKRDKTRLEPARASRSTPSVLCGYRHRSYPEPSPSPPNDHPPTHPPIHPTWAAYLKGNLVHLQARPPSYGRCSSRPLVVGADAPHSPSVRGRSYRGAAVWDETCFSVFGGY